MDDLESVELELRGRKEASRRKEEESVIEQIKVNPKVFYSYARRKTVIRSKIGPLLVKGQTVSGEKEMADILSAQYEGVCSSPRKDINSDGFLEELLGMDTRFETDLRLEDLWFEEEETRKTIGKLSNGAAVGPDGIPTQCYKYGGDMVVSAVVDIARQSLQDKEIPPLLKQGWVTPIWKGSDLSLPSDYRPISLTCHLGKILERLVRSQVTNYLNSNNLLEETQHGSRNGRGTLTQLLKQ